MMGLHPTNLQKTSKLFLNESHLGEKDNKKESLLRIEQAKIGCEFLQ